MADNRFTFVGIGTIPGDLTWLVRKRSDLLKIVHTSFVVDQIEYICYFHGSNENFKHVTFYTSFLHYTYAVGSRPEKFDRSVSPIDLTKFVQSIRWVFFLL